MPAPLPPPGWYPDPADPRGWRWWDGRGWTPYAAPPASPAPAAYPGSPPLPQRWGAHRGVDAREWAAAALETESTVAPWARAATVVYAAAAIAAGFIDLATASAWRAYFHSQRVLFDSIGGNAPPPHVTHVPQWIDLTLPFSLGAEVVFLVWQYRAATTARRLGYPAKRSPGLGVGSYFIPVVNLWFPYQALRDCLPPASKDRQLVLAVWLLLILTAVVGLSMLVLLAEVPALGDAFLAVYVVLEVGLAVGGCRMVQAITSAHRRTLAPG